MGNDRARVALTLYALVAGLALALAFARGEPDLYHHPAPWLRLPCWVELALGVTVGGLFGLGVVWLTQSAVVRWRWRPAVGLHRGLRHMLGVQDAPLRETEVLALALSSAVAEEMLFRGWLQPLAGLVLASLAFGLLHYAPGRRDMRVWVPMAAGIGIVLGLMYQVLGGLSGPVTAHLVINYRNLHFVSSYDPAVGGALDPREARRA